MSLNSRRGGWGISCRRQDWGGGVGGVEGGWEALQGTVYMVM